MGNCAYPQYTKNKNGGNSKNMMMIKNWRSTVKIVHMDGRLQEFWQPIKAVHVLSQNPKTSFLCSSESMYVDCVPPHVPEDEELQLGQIYFFMPLSKSRSPLTLQELCSLAIKASAAISNHHLITTTTTTNGVSYRSSSRQACREVRVGSGQPPPARRNQRIGF